jgi:hypothetical protein
MLCCKEGTTLICELRSGNTYHYGRASSCQIRPAQREFQHRVSRTHAVLRVARHGTVELQDNSSTFGTWLKSRDRGFSSDQASWHRLPPGRWVALNDGDLLGIGAPHTIPGETHRNPHVYTFRKADGGRSHGSLSGRKPCRHAGESSDAEGYQSSRQHQADKLPPADRPMGPGLSPTRISDAACQPPEGGDHATQLPLDDTTEHLVCPICHELMAAAYLLGCGHATCGCCLLRWAQQNPTCPICRAGLTGMLF